MLLVGAVMISSFIFAQNDVAAPEKRHGGRGESMKTVLSLDDAQYSSIKEINKKYGEKQRTLRRDSTLKREDKFKEIKNLNEQRQSEVDKVLTPEQNKKWSTYKKERIEKRKAAGEKRVKAYDEKLKKELSLTDDQYKKLQEMHQRDREHFKKRHHKK